MIVNSLCQTRGNRRHSCQRHHRICVLIDETEVVERSLACWRHHHPKQSTKDLRLRPALRSNAEVTRPLPGGVVSFSLIASSDLKTLRRRPLRDFPCSAATIVTVEGEQRTQLANR